MFGKISKFFDHVATEIAAKKSEDVKTDSAIATAVKDDDPGETFDLDLPHVDREDC